MSDSRLIITADSIEEAHISDYDAADVYREILLCEDIRKNGSSDFEKISAMVTAYKHIKETLLKDY